MKTIRLTLWTILLGLTGLWVAANLPLPDSLTVIATRNLLLQYSGVLAIAAMSVAMILATRWAWVDRWLNGLDKSYGLHKWLGIAALVASISMLALTRQIGRRRRVAGRIASTLNFPSMKVTEAEITLDAAWPGMMRGSLPLSPSTGRKASIPLPSPQPGTRKPGRSQ